MTGSKKQPALHRGDKDVIVKIMGTHFNPHESSMPRLLSTYLITGSRVVKISLWKAIPWGVCGLMRDCVLASLWV